MNVDRNNVGFLPEAIIQENVEGLGHNEDKPEKKPEAEPHKHFIMPQSIYVIMVYGLR